MVEHGHPSRQPIPFGLSLAAGGGLILMVTSLGVGVTQGDAANGSLLGLLFVGGLLLLIGGIIAWVFVTRPFDHFDDINVPKDTGHGHGHDASHAEAEVLLPDGMQPVVTAVEGHEAPHAALSSGH